MAVSTNVYNYRNIHTNLPSKYFNIEVKRNPVGVSIVELLDYDGKVYGNHRFPISQQEAQHLYDNWSKIVARYGYLNDEYLRDEFKHVLRYNVVSISQQKEYHSQKLLLEAQKKKDDEIANLVLIYWGLIGTHTIPEETVSALELFEEGLEIERETYRRISEHKKKVASHYKKYGSLVEKFISYLK